MRSVDVSLGIDRASMGSKLPYIWKARPVFKKNTLDLLLREVRQILIGAFPSFTWLVNFCSKVRKFE